MFYRLICALLALVTLIRVRAVLDARRRVRAESRLRAMRTEARVAPRQGVIITMSPTMVGLEDALLGAAYREARRYLV